MPATPIAVTNRFINPEVTAVYWLDTVADLDDGPLRSELDAGQDLSAEIAAMTGWEISADRVAVPDLGSRFTSRISGRTNPGDSQIVFYGDQETADIRDVLARGDQGYIYIADGGDVVGQKARLFAVDVSAVTPTTDVAGTEAARIMVDFAITGVNETVLIPT